MTNDAPQRADAASDAAFDTDALIAEVRPLAPISPPSPTAVDPSVPRDSTSEANVSHFPQVPNDRIALVPDWAAVESFYGFGLSVENRAVVASDFTVAERETGSVISSDSDSHVDRARRVETMENVAPTEEPKPDLTANNRSPFSSTCGDESGGEEQPKEKSASAGTLPIEGDQRNDDDRKRLPLTEIQNAGGREESSAASEAASCDDEPSPAGLPPELLDDHAVVIPDWASVVAELTALRQEVKLQARVFKRVEETLRAFVGDEDARTMPAWVRQLLSFTAETVREEFQLGVENAAALMNESRREADQEAAAAEEAGFMKAAEALMDARDKLDFGLREARVALNALSPWRGWLGGREAPAAALRGQELALARLEDALRGMGLEFIAQAGAPFDPECMRAVERVSARERKVGVVAEVVKQGYRRNGEKVRTADVKVTAEDPAGA